MRTYPALMPVLGLALAALPASAAPVDDFLARLNEGLAPIGARIDATPVVGKASSGEARMKLKLTTPSGTIPLGRDVLFGPIESWDDGRLFAEEIVISGFDHTNDGVQVEADTITLSFVTLPLQGEDDPFILSQMLGGLAFDGLTITDDGDSLEVDHIDYAMGVEPEFGSTAPTTMAIAATVRGLLIGQRLYDVLELNNSPFPEEYLVGQKVDAYLPLHWDLAQGLLTISEASVTIPTLGRFATGFQLGGVTLPLVEEIVGFSMASAMGAPADEKQQQAMGLKLLGNLTYVAGTVSVADSGIVDALMAYGKRAFGRTDDEVKAFVADVADDGLGGLGVPAERIEGLVTTVIDFADQGGTFGLDAFPDSPPTLMELVALGQTPGALLDRIDFEPVHIAPEVPVSEAPQTEIPAEAPVSGPLPTDYLTRLKAYLELAGGRLEYGLSDTTTEVGNLTSFVISPPSGAPFVFPSEGYVPNVEALPGDVLRSGLALGALSRTEMGATVGFDSLTINDLLLPPVGSDDRYLSLQAPGSWTIRGLTVEGGAGAITADSVNVTLTGDPIGAFRPDSIYFSVNIQNLSIPHSMADAFGDSPMLLLAGHSYDVSLQGTWEPKTGEIKLPLNTVTMRGLGGLSLSAKFDGFDDSLFEAAWTYMSNSPAEQQAALQALSIRVLSQLRFQSATMTINDTGLVDTILELAALNTGVDKERALAIYADQIKGFGEESNYPPLVADVEEDLRPFLTDGGALTVYATPRQPLSLLQIGAVANSPGGVLLDQLQLSLSHAP